MKKVKNPLGEMGLFATPDDVKALESYVEMAAKSSPDNGALFVTIMGMTWNLCKKLVDQANEEPEPEIEILYKIK